MHHFTPGCPCSPYPPIEDGPYPPIYEFVTTLWSSGDRDKIAMVDGSTGLQRTFSDYAATATGLATALKHDMSVHEDSCVALYCPNHVDYAPIVLGVALCGARLTPINPLYTQGELETVLQKSRSSVLLVHSSRLDVALEAVRNCPRVEYVIVVTDAEAEPVPHGTVSLHRLRLEYSHHHSKRHHIVTETVQEIHHKTETHPYLLPYSSGTTGQPKGVCLTHANIVANLLQLEQVESLAFASDHSLISPLPFYHIYALTVSVLYCAWKKQTVITMSQRFDLDTFQRLVETHRPQRAHLVPPIILQLAKHTSSAKYDLTSLQTIVSAAAPLSSEVEQAVMAKLPHCQVKQAWGMSELSPIGTMNSDYNTKSGSIGPLVSSTAAKIVDIETGRSLPSHQTGELLIHGPQVMLGYLDDPDKTLECLSPSRWLRTGDVAYYDEDGFFYITDRIKELIKVRGYPVAPAELEALLLTHEAIDDCAVIGKPDEASGEVPRAYIVLAEGGRMTSQEEIYNWVKERVAPYKRLDGGIVFKDDIPKSASGKILRRFLRDELRAEINGTSSGSQ